MVAVAYFRAVAKRRILLDVDVVADLWGLFTAVVTLRGPFAAAVVA